VKIARCSSPKCQAPIIWITTPNGRKQPVDAEGKRLIVIDVTEAPGGPEGRVRTCYTPHHATCADVEAFREKAGAQADLGLDRSKG